MQITRRLKENASTVNFLLVPWQEITPTRKIRVESHLEEEIGTIFTTKKLLPHHISPETLTDLLKLETLFYPNFSGTQI
jgi:hypothetical protein